MRLPGIWTMLSCWMLQITHATSATTLMNHTYHKMQSISHAHCRAYPVLKQQLQEDAVQVWLVCGDRCCPMQMLGNC
jgi:hypothetical protein